MYNYPNSMLYRNDTNRFGGFLVPFLLGGLGGSAIVGLSRPRPVVVNPTYPYPYPYYPNSYPNNYPPYYY